MTTDNEYDAIDSNEKVTDTKEEEDRGSLLDLLPQLPISQGMTKLIDWIMFILVLC